MSRMNCRWCDQLVESEFSEGELAIYTDDGEITHYVKIISVMCGPCQNKFGDIPNGEPS